MGVIKQGILGGFSGRVAGVVGSSWKGIAYMKALPLSVANPKTAGQIAQRTKFSQTVLFATQILSIFIKPMWDRFAVQMSGYNEFCQINIEKFDVLLENPWINFILSKGKMAATAIESAIRTGEDDGIIFAWLDDSGEGLKLSTDIPFVAGIDEDGNAIGYSDPATNRESLALIMPFAHGAELKKAVQVWLGFRRLDGTIVSDSSQYTVLDAP